VSLKQTPLYENHKNLEAKIVDFAGYEMPVSYSTVKQEWESVRKQVGIFDISHMAPIVLEGSAKDLIQLINYSTCRDITELKIGQVQYNAVMNENGGLVDDVTIYKISADQWTLIVNASNKHNVLTHLNEQILTQGFSVKANIPSEYTLIALQGPNAEEALVQIMPQYKGVLSNLFFYEFLSTNDTNLPGMISRTGYTGEDGFELLQTPEAGKETWEKLIEIGVQPCGLASRDMLRLEVMYPLYGNELNSGIGPYKSGIGWLLSGDKDFMGKNIALAEKQNKDVRTFGFQVLKPGVPRAGCKIIDSNGKNVGTVTSGTHCFAYESGFGMAFFYDGRDKAQEYFVQVRDKSLPIKTFIKPPYSGSIKRR
jgi:aminomethyltransferase